MDGYAIVYCEGAFGKPSGKTAHGLVRRTSRYRVLSVVDSASAGQDARQLLDGRGAGIPILSNLDQAIQQARQDDAPATHFVIGLAPDGGRLPAAARRDVLHALQAGLNVDSGLHDFLSQDRELAALAAKHSVSIRDVRKPPPREALHFFSGKIEQVTARKVAVLGTDSAIGKRTTAWVLVDALNDAGRSAELVGTGQTAWLQGVRYGIILDSLVNDFVAGELEHAVWSAWKEQQPNVIVIEGQGSLMNPAYPGGLEILAAARPDVIILQHAPARQDYDGFPGYRVHPLDKQIRAIELLSEKPVVAITINPEGLDASVAAATYSKIRRTTGLPAGDVLRDGASSLIEAILA